MKGVEEVRAEHKLDAITHYLLRAFPGAAIALHRAHRGDYLVTVCSGALEDTHLLHIAKTVLNDVHPTVEALIAWFDELRLPQVLREHGEYRLDGPSSPSQ